jgi:hypothetical protein
MAATKINDELIGNGSIGTVTKTTANCLLGDA